MATYDLTYLNDNFEEIARKKMQRDFENFLIASDNAKVDQRIRELEKQGMITVHWGKLNNDTVVVNQSELSPRAIKIAKVFVFGVCCGIGLILLLL